MVDKQISRITGFPRSQIRARSRTIAHQLRDHGVGIDCGGSSPQGCGEWDLLVLDPQHLPTKDWEYWFMSLRTRLTIPSNFGSDFDG